MAKHNVTLSYKVVDDFLKVTRIFGRIGCKVFEVVDSKVRQKDGIQASICGDLTPGEKQAVRKALKAYGNHEHPSVAPLTITRY